MRLIIISVLILVFISGCQEKTFSENNFLKINLEESYEFSLPEKWKNPVFNKLDRSLCEAYISGECVLELEQGYYESTCLGPDAQQLCSSGRICQVTETNCDNSGPSGWECGCEDLISDDVQVYCSDNPSLDCSSIFLTTTCENALYGNCQNGNCFVDLDSWVCGSTAYYGDCYCFGDSICHNTLGEPVSSPDCEALEMHNVCNLNGECVEVEGQGSDQCSSDNDCEIIEEKYNICNINGECVEVEGQGSDQCSSDNDCFAGSDCGNGIVQPYLFEECDGSDLNGESCFSFGYSGGSLSCNGDCTFNQNNCY
jgi:hypothetical protein